MARTKKDPLLDELDPQERYNLERLRDRMKSVELSPESVGELLPRAVIVGERGRPRLSKSMVAVTERAIDLSVKSEPVVLSTALFPIIGSAIRKAINKLLADGMAGMNAGLESAVSFRRLRWRVESWRTQLPYGEIVLRHTLRYRVEHVLLIHEKTGILLLSASAEGAATADDDMVASMLKVVQDYIKDSLALPKAESVNGISVGDRTVLVEEGPRASLALILKGAADPDLRARMQDALESIHLRYAAELEGFTGDLAPFEEGSQLLRSCLASAKKGGRQGKPIYAIAALCALAVAAAAWATVSIAAGARRNAFVDALSAEPGMMVASARRKAGATEVRILRDPRARSIDSVAREFGVDLGAFRFEVEEFVSPSLAGGAGTEREESLPGARNFSGRVIPDSLLALSRRLAGYSLFFQQDSEELREGQESMVREVGDLIAEIVATSRKEGFSVSIEVTGHAAGSLQDEASLSISDERARKAMELFARVDAPIIDHLHARGIGISEPVVAQERTEEDRIRNRSVTFKAIFR